MKSVLGWNPINGNAANLQDIDRQLRRETNNTTCSHILSAGVVHGDDGVWPSPSQIRLPARFLNPSLHSYLRRKNLDPFASRTQVRTKAIHCLSFRMRIPRSSL